MRTLLTRDAETSPGDGQFIVDAFDSTLPYLTSIGSGEQWGSVPFSERPGFIQETLDSVSQSEEFCRTGTGEAIRVLLCEFEITQELLPTGSRIRTDDSGNLVCSVGTAVLRENWIPSYISEHITLNDRLAEQRLKDGFIYLEVMVTDYRLGLYRRGAGAALIQAAKEYGKLKGKKILYVDAWAGNGRRLVQ